MTGTSGRVRTLAPGLWRLCLRTGAEARNSLHHGLHLVRGDEPRAFELARGVLVTRTIHEILVVEAVPHIVPARIAGMVVDHPVGRLKLVGRMGEAADQHHRLAHRPGEPGQAAGEPDEKLGVPEPARAFLQRAIARLVLGPGWDAVP